MLTFFKDSGPDWLEFFVVGQQQPPPPNAGVRGVDGRRPEGW